MEENESVLKFANRIRQLAASLKAMNVDIPQSEMAMALLNGLPQEYNALISALDAVDDDDTELDWEFVKSRIMQEEQRINMRTQSALKKSETSGLVSKQLSSNHCSNCSSSHRSRPHCTHCNKDGHLENKCWVKYPQLNPLNKKGSDNKPAFIAAGSIDDLVVCLMAKYEKSSEPKKSGNWYIDSGCSNHMTYGKDLFSAYSSGSSSTVELRNSNVANVSGSGTVDIALLVNNKRTRCRLSNVLCHITNHALITRTMELWHRRLAHISPSVIREMSNKNAVRGLDDVKNLERFQCPDCLTGKGHRSPFP